MRRCTFRCSERERKLEKLLRRARLVRRFFVDWSEQELFRQEPQPPVKGKNLDDGCHASRLREHASVGPPVPMPVFDWQAENIRYTGFFSLVTSQFKTVRVLAQVPHLRGTRTVSAGASTSRERQKPRRRVPCSSLAWACGLSKQKIGAGDISRFGAGHGFCLFNRG